LAQANLGISPRTDGGSLPFAALAALGLRRLFVFITKTTITRARPPHPCLSHGRPTPSNNRSPTLDDHPRRTAKSNANRSSTNRPIAPTSHDKLNHSSEPREKETKLLDCASSRSSDACAVTCSRREFGEASNLTRAGPGRT
jgi:hypothetical protein